MSIKTKATAMKKEAERLLVPTLRFPEFLELDGWKKTTLGDITTKTDKRNKGGKSYPVYSISNKTGFTPQSEQFEGVDSEQRGYDIALYKLIESNTFAYNPARINVGSFGYSGRLNNIIISSLYVCFKTKPDTADQFLLHFLETSEFEKSVNSHVEGGIRSYLFYENFARIGICRPSLPEQLKIAECLSSVDELMAAQARKVDALKTHKKGLMRQLFPVEGETQPRLRFPQFQRSKEWVQKALGEIFPITSSKRVHESDWTPRGVPFYRAREIVALNKGEPIQPLFISEELYAAYSRLTGEIRDGHLLVTGVGSIGVPYLVRKEDRFYFKDGNIIWLKNDGEELSGEFLHRLFETDFVQKQLKTMADVGTVATYTIDNAKRTLAAFPREKDEQLCIASFLSGLDARITAETQKLEALESHKKGLMQQLFPRPSGVEA
jgi:type I restriction enzyme S subunit